SPDKLKFYRDGEDISGGGIPATQAEIDKVIKLSYNAFINVVCFGQHNHKQFLSCTAADKRAIAENLLSLDKYNKYSKKAKDDLKLFQDKMKTLSAVYEKTLHMVETGERQIKQIIKQQDEWKSNQLNAIERLDMQIIKAKAEM